MTQVMSLPLFLFGLIVDPREWVIYLPMGHKAPLPQKRLGITTTDAILPNLQVQVVETANNEER